MSKPPPLHKKEPGQSGHFLECLRECICRQCPNSPLLWALGKMSPGLWRARRKGGQMAHKRDKPGKSCCKCVLQKTMKGAHKAIVAKSFGEWGSGSPRGRTMAKPDELSEESGEQEILSSRRTCDPPQQQGKEPGLNYLIFFPLSQASNLWLPVLSTPPLLFISLFCFVYFFFWYKF